MEIQILTNELSTHAVSINTWYYTLSTSAQVLAALAGLFAVFVVYKIQSTQVLFDDTKIAFMKLIDRYSSIIEGYVHIRFIDMHFWDHEKLLEKVKEINQIKNNNPEKLKAIIPGVPHNQFSYDISDEEVEYYENLLGKRKEILKLLKSNSVILSSAMFVCLLGLAFSDSLEISNYPVYIGIVLFFVIASVIILAKDVYTITKI